MDISLDRQASSASVIRSYIYIQTLDIEFKDVWSFNKKSCLLDFYVNFIL